jgi:hypothetical protein
MKTQGENRLGRGGILILAVLVALLVAAVIYALQVWQSMSGVAMSVWGWVFLVLGAVVTLGLGVGLMALVFYSAHNDRDI